MRRERTKQGGFTLPELLTVVAMMILIGTFSLPTVFRALNSGAEAQAFNMVYAQMNAARTLAMKTGNFTCLHFQVATGHTALRDTCFAGVFAYSTTTNTFSPAPGYDLLRIPGKMALGRITPNTSSGTVYLDNAGNFQNVSDASGNIDPYFTEGTVIFAPNGTVVTQVNGQNIAFAATTAWTSFWDPTYVSTTGITALTLFNYAGLYGSDVSWRNFYMSQNGEIIPINVYSGQLLSRR